MDLDDLEHNTRDGLHLASLAGTWIALVPGLAGLGEGNGGVAFAPRLPAGITGLAITICIMNSRLRIEITSQRRPTGSSTGNRCRCGTTDSH